MSSPAAAFYFDLASPLAYLLAERVLHELPLAAEWQPVLARELADAASPPDAVDRAARERLERRALELGLQPLRWPEPFPFDSALAMRRKNCCGVSITSRVFGCFSR